MADITDIERLNYYEGEYLGALDFEAEQEYHRDMRRRHNLGPHTQGIVSGLDVAQFLNGGADNEVDVYIQPGVAVDGYGREVVVLAPYQLTADLFADFSQKQTLSVWIGYTQQMISPSSDSCTSSGQTNAYSRIQETFQIVVDPISPTHDPVVVGGNEVSLPSKKGWKQPAWQPTLPANEGDVALPFDDSVAFQALPDGSSTATWLIPLGKVLWDGPNQRFLQTSAAIANSLRPYAGAVAAGIDAPAGSLTIKDRSTPSPLPKDAQGTNVTVEGTLTIDRLTTAKDDVWIDGGEVYFKTSDGTDGDAILGIQRIDSSAGPELHIHIGDNSNPNIIPQLTVGQGKKGSTDTDVFTVGADGNATLPAGSLSFGTQQSQMLNLSGTGYGIGVQTATLYLRSASDFAFYVGGSWVADQDKPGNGGSVSAILDSQGDMTFSGALVVDDANNNNASIAPGLTFGHKSGEGIASKRTAGGNQYGLDFYTGFALRMSVGNNGNVGIGTSAPDAPLNIAGGNWDLKATEGDLKIGNGTYRLKMGVALGGSGAGDGRIRASGGTNRLMLGTGSSDVLTINGTNVGIGTTTPGATLDVAGTINTIGANVNGPLNAFMINASSSVTVGGVMNANYAIFAGATSNGDITLNGNLIMGGWKLGYVVDRFYSRAKKPLEQGDLVVVHTRPVSVFYGTGNRIPLVEVALASKTGDTRICGVVDEPSLTEAQTPGLDRKAIGNGNVGLMVTLGAYAYCKVTAEPGPIESGDLLMASETPGHAQKADPLSGIIAGAVIGKALGSLKKGTGIIPVFISHQ